MNMARLNWLRAGVLGANDGIISVAVLLVSIVGVLSHDKMIVVGISGIVAGAVSMALGEYVSVSAQRDAERAAQSAEHTNPVHAAISSFVAFVSGAVIPLAFAALFESVLAVFVAVLVAVTLTTIISVRFGKAKLGVQLARNVIGGGLALSIGLVLNATFGTF
jgi:VIT1/CCC1 family predicted Fe2+/Mn2+ transporter